MDQPRLAVAPASGDDGSAAPEGARRRAASGDGQAADASQRYLTLLEKGAAAAEEFLAEARTEAEAMLARSREEGEAIIAQARAEADGLVDQARSEAAKARGVADQHRAEADRARAVRDEAVAAVERTREELARIAGSLAPGQPGADRNTGGPQPVS